MSFLFPFFVSISRVAYAFSAAQGASQSTTVIVPRIRASIQLKRDKGASSPVGFAAPTDTSAPLPYWTIIVPLSVGDMNTIKDGDMVTDLGQPSRVFKVDAAEYTPLGWGLSCSLYKPDA